MTVAGIVLLIVFIGVLVLILGGLHKEGMENVRRDAGYPWRRPRW